MPQYPNTVMDLFSLTDIGKRLNDPGPAYQALQMMFGWQIIVGTADEPGPLASMAVNVVNGPSLGTGNSINVQLPYALAGRELKIINLSGSTVNTVVQPYNPATGVPDVLLFSSGNQFLTIGSVTIFLAYEPGFWVQIPASSPPVTAPSET